MTALVYFHVVMNENVNLRSFFNGKLLFAFLVNVIHVNFT